MCPDFDVVVRLLNPSKPQSRISEGITVEKQSLAMESGTTGDRGVYEPNMSTIT